MKPPELKRELGAISAILITVGGVIGSGIFMKPLPISQFLPGEMAIYLLWFGLGLVCLAGALAYGELSTLFPDAGGQYTYLREAWGPGAAFLYGWTFFFVINSGTAAALAVAFARAVHQVHPLSDLGSLFVALLAIGSLAGINHFGVSAGAWFQNISTLAKVGALLTIVAGAVFAETKTVTVSTISARPEASLTNFVQAALAMFWAYEGWHQLSFSAAEVRDPQKNLARGFVGGMLVLVVIYLAVNAAYIHLVPLEEMRTFKDGAEVPKTAIHRSLGESWAGAFAWLLAISVLGSSNTNYMSSPRAFYAMARDGLFFRQLAHISPRWHTPTVAIWVQAGLAGVIVFVLRHFEDITEYVVFAALIFYALSVAGVYVLRHTRPELPRPFRCPFYPVTPALFVVAALFVDIVLLLDPANRRNALLGLILIGAGLPVYLLFFRRSTKSKTPPT